jgi:hypothetical protein
MINLIQKTRANSSRNGPSCIQFQGRWFEKLIKTLEDDGVQTFEATEQSADEWVEKIREIWEATLLPQGKISELVSIVCSVYSLLCTVGGRVPISPERRSSL